MEPLFSLMPGLIGSLSGLVGPILTFLAGILATILTFRASKRTADLSAASRIDNQFKILMDGWNIEKKQLQDEVQNLNKEVRTLRRRVYDLEEQVAHARLLLIRNGIDVPAHIAGDC